MDLNRTDSLWNRQNRNGINQNWGKIENDVNALKSFTEGFDGSKLLERTANMFNKDQAGYGSINPSTGEARSDGFRNTGFIKVDPDTIYRMNPSLGMGAMYNKEYDYVAPINTPDNTVRTTLETMYVRVSVSGSQMDSTMFYKGSEHKPYEPYGFKPTAATSADSLTINRGKDHPLNPFGWSGSTSGTIHEVAKNAILDAQVYGALPNKVYRLAFVANGNERDGTLHYSITVQEQNVGGGGTRIVTNYIDHVGVKGSDGIDTIMQGNDDIMFKVVVDRKVISDSSSPTFLNLQNSANAIIKETNYNPF